VLPGDGLWLTVILTDETWPTNGADNVGFEQLPVFSGLNVTVNPVPSATNMGDNDVIFNTTVCGMVEKTVYVGDIEDSSINVGNIVTVDGALLERLTESVSPGCNVIGEIVIAI